MIHNFKRLWAPVILAEKLWNYFHWSLATARTSCFRKWIKWVKYWSVTQEPCWPARCRKSPATLNWASAVLWTKSSCLTSVLYLKSEWFVPRQIERNILLQLVSEAYRPRHARCVNIRKVKISKTLSSERVVDKTEWWQT